MMCKLRLVDCRLSRNLVHDLTDIQLYIILIYSLVVAYELVLSLVTNYSS